MRVKCTHGCGLEFDDAVRDTICPHPELIGPYAHPESEKGKADQAKLKDVLKEFIGPHGGDLIEQYERARKEHMQATQATPQMTANSQIAPKLHPFINPPISRCGQCDFGHSRIFLFLHWILGMTIPSCHAIAFCPGGKAPSEQAAGIPGQLFGAQSEFKCAGIYTPHLHLRCGRCGVETLHELRPGK